MPVVSCCIWAAFDFISTGDENRESSRSTVLTAFVLKCGSERATLRREAQYVKEGKVRPPHGKRRNGKNINLAKALRDYELCALGGVVHTFYRMNKAPTAHKLEEHFSDSDGAYRSFHC